MRSYASAAVLSLMLACAAPSQAEPSPATIAFKAAGPEDYIVRTSETSVKELASTTAPFASDDYMTSEAMEVTRQTITPNAGVFDVAVKTLKKTLKVNGKDVEEELPLHQFTYRMNARGERPDEPISDDPMSKLQPLLPERPVLPGFAWSVVVPPSKKFTVPLKVAYTYVGNDSVQGFDCALIKSSGEAVGKDKDLAFALRVSGAMYVALNEGILVKSSTLTTFDVKALKALFKGGFKTTRHSVERTIARIPK